MLPKAVLRQFLQILLLITKLAKPYFSRYSENDFTRNYSKSELQTTIHRIQIQVWLFELNLSLTRCC